MSKIKSERAYEFAREQEFYAQHSSPVIERDDYERAIILAEQDAEERAIKAFAEFSDHLGQTANSNREIYQDSEQYIDIFKQLLNGEQSDE